MADSITVQVETPVAAEETKVDDALVTEVVATLTIKMETGRLEEGSSKAIRKAMEAAAKFALKGAEKKEVVLAALNLLAARAPEKWQPTLAVASTQIDELFKIAQGLSKLNANSTLADVNTQLEVLASTSAVQGCFPCLKKKKSPK